VKAESVTDKLKLTLERNTQFSEEISIKGHMFAKNPYSGLYMEPEQARKFSAETEVRIAHEINEAEAAPVVAHEVCKICWSEMIGEVLPLSACGHLYHPDCIVDYFNYEILSTQFPMSCPECKVEVPVMELQTRLNVEMMAKFEDFSFKFYVQRNMKDLSLCPTPDCRYVFIWESESPHFICSLCKKEYCLSCHTPYHKGVECEEFQKWKDVDYLDEKFHTLSKASKYKQCPECKFWVERSEGCDHMTCRCAFEFCYVCGGVYGSCNCDGEENGEEEDDEEY
jgi:hypothetical protein